MPGGGTNYVVHGIKDDSTLIDYGPFNTANQATNFANDEVASGNIVDYTITYTDAHGNTVEYEQT